MIGEASLISGQLRVLLPGQGDIGAYKLYIADQISLITHPSQAPPTSIFIRKVAGGGDIAICHKWQTMSALKMLEDIVQLN